MKCTYKNCSKELSEGKRSGALFCNRDCKNNNRKMKKYYLEKGKWIRVSELNEEQILTIKQKRNDEEPNNIQEINRKTIHC